MTERDEELTYEQRQKVRALRWMVADPQIMAEMAAASKKRAGVLPQELEERSARLQAGLNEPGELKRILDAAPVQPKRG